MNLHYGSENVGNGKSRIMIFFPIKMFYAYDLLIHTSISCLTIMYNISEFYSKCTNSLVIENHYCRIAHGR